VARSSARAWWTQKVGRVASFVFGRVSAEERAAVATALTRPQVALFESMPRPDQRHGLDVAETLRRAGFAGDTDLIAAALLHDAGKGRSARLWHRVAWSLGHRYGRRVTDVAGRMPGARPVFERLDRHAELSAELARAAGASDRTVQLIAEQGEARDPAAHVLQLADDGELPVRR
jgi:hypothetical protein